MTKISQLVDIGASLAANDELLIRDVSDGSTPNKKVTASGLFNVATALGFTGLDLITAGVANEAKVQVFASGISGRTDTTLSGVVVARTTISGYYENASGTVGGVLFPVVTQTDIGTAPNQVPVNGMLGSMAFQDANFPSLGSAAITQINNVPLLSGGGIKFPPTQVASADANTLDDYEEGTWTPSLGGTATYTVQLGRYAKIGRLVYANFYVTVGTIGTGSAWQMTGLPFTANNSVQGGGSVNYWAALGASFVYVTPYTFSNTTISFYALTAAGASLAGATSVFGNGSTVQGFVIYEAQ
jgi:hypothetical protein